MGTPFGGYISPTGYFMLTEVQARKAKPAERPYKLSDGGGLYLYVMPNGARYWRMKYRVARKENVIAFGVYPEVSLAEARARRDEARALLRNGKDPSTERKAAREAAAVSGETFGTVAAEWLQRQRGSMAATTFAKAQWMLNQTMKLHARPIRGITAPEVLSVLRAIEMGGRHETTHRIKQRIGQVMRYAVATGRAERDVTADLKGALSPPTTKHHPAITEPAAVGELLRAIEGFNGQPATHAALRIAPYLFQRPGNIRKMEWTELDLDAAEWRIPTDKMKMRSAHCPAGKAGRGDSARYSGDHGQRPLLLSVQSWTRPTAEQWHAQRCAAALGIRQKHHDDARIPGNGVLTVERKGMEPGRDRAAASPRRAQQGPRGV